MDLSWPSSHHSRSPLVSGSVTDDEWEYNPSINTIPLGDPGDFAHFDFSTVNKTVPGPPQQPHSSLSWSVSSSSKVNSDLSFVFPGSFSNMSKNQPQPQLQSQLQPQLQPQLHSQLQPQLKPQLQPVQPQLQPQLQVQPRLQIQVQPQVQSQVQSRLQSQLQPHPQPQLQYQPQRQSQPQLQPPFQPQRQSQPHPQPQLQYQPQRQSQSQLQPQAQSQHNISPDSVDPGLNELGAILDMDDQGILDKPGPFPQPQPQHQPQHQQPQTQLQTQPQSQPQQQHPTQMQPQTRSKPVKSTMSGMNGTTSISHSFNTFGTGSEPSMLDSVTSTIRAAADRLGFGLETPTTIPTSPVPPSSTKKKAPAVRLNWIEENVLLATVDQPTVVSSTAGFAKHYVFRVCYKTRSQLDHFPTTSHQTKRSSSDFEWFHEHLVKRFPYLLIPPLPGKQFSISDILSTTTDSSRVDQLARQYELFLVRVGRHLTLCQSTDVANFFVLSKEEYMKEREKKWAYVDIEGAEEGGSGWSSLFTSSSSLPKDATILKAYNEIITWKKTIKSLATIAQELELKSREMRVEYEKFEAEISKFSSSPILLSPTSGIKISETSTLHNFSSVVENQTKSAQFQEQINGQVLAEKIFSWVSYSRAAQQLIERYTKIEKKYNQVNSTYITRKEKYDALVQRHALGGISRSDILSLQELEVSMKESDANLQQSLQYYNKVKLTIWEELKKYDKQKAFEIRHWIELYANRQTSNYEKMFLQWSQFSLSIPS
eukprot:TRINITY_DN2235_c1_g1_i3.p1 TRINITY_DN2235_c1_g1~~TRINITY_DN2235_c1_g1_i3.p1  ORF type:complete len:780 (+),score=188.82 TRINITY_DN2235_c1_g1_i3:46-2340(+)